MDCSLAKPPHVIDFPLSKLFGRMTELVFNLMNKATISIKNEAED
jgi:hypothetical protein